MKEMETIQTKECVFMISVSILYGTTIAIYFDSRLNLIHLVLIVHLSQLIMRVIILIDGTQTMFVCHVHHAMSPLVIAFLIFPVTSVVFLIQSSRQFAWPIIYETLAQLQRKCKTYNASIRDLKVNIMHMFSYPTSPFFNRKQFETVLVVTMK